MSPIPFDSYFNIFTLISILPFVLGIASLILITVALVRTAQAQRSIARSLEYIEKSLQNRQ